jgi:ketosteroid isomerase-like protein
MRQWKQLRKTWDADVVEPVGDFIDAADRVVVRQVWRGAGHGPVMNMEMTNVYMVRKGRIVYQEFFWDHAEALETLGLSE